MRRIVCGLLTLTLAGTPVLAGQQPVELGLDAGFGYKVNSPTAGIASLPVQSFRVGFYAGDQVSIEPRLRWNLINFENENSLNSLNTEIGVLIHFSPDRNRPQPYFRPLAAMEVFNGGGGTMSQASIGGAIGVKLPVRDRFAVRLEGGFRRAFESDDFAESSTIFVQVGFSFFTR